jgi:hypothetical protein
MRKPFRIENSLDGLLLLQALEKAISIVEYFHAEKHTQQVIMQVIQAEGRIIYDWE